jgi:hypothetical protein
MNRGVNEEKIFSNADLKSKYIELLAEKSVRKNQYFKRPSLLIADSDGYIVSWEWDFGDGKTSFGRKVQHTYTWTDTGDKSFEVILIVKDNKGGTDYTTKTITVYDNI